jgi:hypothetical protein
MILNKGLISNVSMNMVSQLTTWRLSIFPTEGSKVQSSGFQRPAVPTTSSGTHSTTNHETGPLLRLRRRAQQDSGDGKPNSLESSDLLRPISATAVSSLFSALRIPGSKPSSNYTLAMTFYLQCS